jgi:hypothetical protein
MRQAGSSRLQILALPARDLLSLGLWLWSFVTRRVQWREELYRVTRDGSAQLVEDLTP